MHSIANHEFLVTLQYFGLASILGYCYIRYKNYKLKNKSLPSNLNENNNKIVTLNYNFNDIKLPHLFANKFILSCFRYFKRQSQQFFDLISKCLKLLFPLAFGWASPLVVVKDVNLKIKDEANY